MGRTLTSPLQVARHVLASSTAWLLFVEIPRTSGAGGGTFRLVRASKHVTANGHIWQACPMEIVLPEEDAEGTLGAATIRLPNVSRLPMAYLESGELLGQIATVWLQHESSLTTFVPALSWKNLVVRGKARERGASLECGHPAQTQRLPSRIFDRDRFPQLLPSAGLSLTGGEG